jgi:hypothetical protein
MTSTIQKTEGHSPVGRLTCWLRDKVRRRSDYQEWQSLNSRDRSRIAHDLGIDRAELDVLMQESGGTVELDKLLARTELRETASLSGAMPDLQRVCALCEDKGECRDWLAVPAKPNNHATVPGFCPNRGELNALRVQQIRRGAAANRAKPD